MSEDKSIKIAEGNLDGNAKGESSSFTVSGNGVSDVKIDTVDVDETIGGNFPCRAISVEDGNTESLDDEKKIKTGYERVIYSFKNDEKTNVNVTEYNYKDGYQGTIKEYSDEGYRIIENYDTKNNLLDVQLYDKTTNKIYFLDDNYGLNGEYNVKYDHNFGEDESTYILNVDSIFVHDSNKDMSTKSFYQNGRKYIEIIYKNQFYERKVIKDESGNLVNTQVLDLTTNKKYYYNKNNQLYRVDTFAVVPGAKIQYKNGVSAIYSGDDGYLLINYSEEYVNGKVNRFINGNYESYVKKYVISDPNKYITYVKSTFKKYDDEDVNYFELNNSNYNYYRNDKYEIKEIKDKDGKVVETQILDIGNKKKYYYDSNNNCYRYDLYSLIPGSEVTNNLNKSADGSYLQLHYTYLYNDETKKFDGYNKNSSLYNLTESDDYTKLMANTTDIFSSNTGWVKNDEKGIKTYTSDEYIIKQNLKNDYTIFDRKNNTKYYYNDGHLYRTVKNGNVSYINEKGEIYRIENSSTGGYMEFDSIGMTKDSSIKEGKRLNYNFGKTKDGKDYLAVSSEVGDDINTAYYLNNKTYFFSNGKPSTVYVKTDDNKIIRYYYENDKIARTEIVTDKGEYCNIPKEVIDVDSIKLNESDDVYKETYNDFNSKIFF